MGKRLDMSGLITPFDEIKDAFQEAEKSETRKSYAEMFMSSENRERNQRNYIVQEIPIDSLRPFANHTFSVEKNSCLNDLITSVKDTGVQVPIIVRKVDGVDGYEILAGHTRTYAAKQAGLTKIPAIIKTYIDDEEATIIMGITNLQREESLPSEKAKTYRAMVEATKRQAGRPKKNLSPDAPKYSAATLIGERTKESRDQVYRYIRLTYLIDELLQMVDDKKLKFTQAVLISYLTAEQQNWILQTINEQKCSVSNQQAQQLKEFSSDDALDAEIVREILAPQKPEKKEIVVKSKKFASYFPGMTATEMESKILEILDQWKAAQNN
jgi:ParB family transcriptional regulator, chromosome partitioning protein